jgi:glucose-6-phosphate-specific signal transduction histidine kinase
LAGISLLCEWRVISIVGAGLSGVLKVGEAPGLPVEGLIERVNSLNGVIRLNAKSGPEVVVVLADEGVERDDETITLVVVELMDVELLSPSK